MAAIAQMNKLRITNPYTHNGRITNPAERILLLLLLFQTGLLSSCSQQGKTANKEEGVALGDTIESIVEQLAYLALSHPSTVVRLSASYGLMKRDPHLAAEIAIKGVLDTSVCEIANP